MEHLGVGVALLIYVDLNLTLHFAEGYIVGK